MKTKVFFESFKGGPIFSIWEINDKDQKIGKYPLISIGLKKAALLVKHVKDLESFVKIQQKSLNEGRN